MNTNVIVTDHAYKRVKERMGLNRSAADKLSSKAFSRGIRHTDTKGRLQKYISERATSETRNSNTVRIYGEFVYCFYTRENRKGQTETARLLTVYGIPNELKSQVLGTKRRKVA